MRGQDLPVASDTAESDARSLAGLLLFVATAAIAQVCAERAPQLTGPTPPMADRVPRSRCRNGSSMTSAQMRTYPEQPPVIPHSIEGYQLSVNANRCLSCHKREFTAGLRRADDQRHRTT